MKKVSLSVAALTLALILAACGQGAPQDGQLPTVGSVTYDAQTGQATILASDNVGISKLEYSIDTGPVITLKVSGKGPYTIPLPSSLKPGPHTIKVTVFDSAGNPSKKYTLSITVLDRHAPTKVVLSSTAPLTDPITRAGPLGLSVAAQDNVKVTRVEFYDGATKIAEDTTPDDGFTASVDFAAGNQSSHQYSARAYDAAGNASAPSNTLSVNVNIPGLPVDVPAPTNVVLSREGDGPVTQRGGSVLLKVTAEGAVDHVFFYDNGVQVGTGDFDSYNFV